MFHGFSGFSNKDPQPSAEKKCPNGRHNYKEVYDEVPRPYPTSFKVSGGDPEQLSVLLYYRVVRAIFCTKCGDQLELKS